MIYFGKINTLAACVALERLLYPNAFRNAALAVLTRSTNASARLVLRAQVEREAARKMRPHLSHLNARKYQYITTCGADGDALPRPTSATTACLPGQ